MGLLSSIYSAVLSGRDFLYRSGLKKTGKLSEKVISVGNLTLGGTGKTPAVIAIASEAKKRGLHPCILTRGYKGRAKGPCVVSLGEGPVLNVTQAGDEPVLMSERMDGVPIIMGKNRFEAGLFALNNTPLEYINLFILDDGYQHLGLYRDKNILLIDVSNPFGNGKLFPEGILREPVSAVSRANAVVITKTDTSCSASIDALKLAVREHNPAVQIFTSFHKPTGFINSSGDMKDLESLTQKPVRAFAGIANPAHFKNLLASKGLSIANFRSYRDHHYYSQHDIDKIVNDAGGMDIITTEKDLVKLRKLNLPDNIYALRIEFLVDDDFFEYIFS